MLLDTNIISELRKIVYGKASPAIVKWEATVSATELMISVITVQELEIGILRLERKDPRQASVLREWLTKYVLVEFRHRILPVTTEIARRSAALLIDDDVSCEDALIASTAYVHNMPVVTRNIKHFADLGADVINPWDDFPKAP
jgi:predicted nucleic acid-binding protein